ncbi:MAG: hypothetical protein UR99_C0064G0002 [Candidatus Moranbacteria bacterium GW2011_GWD2_36_12]|nr:MAG: hypothetical protein UR99_C0064G0002 [Candidatus Moranbacteria bacterium GW2011_GWD2_36_12]
MGCPNAPDRDFKRGMGGNHRFIMYDRRKGQKINPDDSNPDPCRYQTNLYRCQYCGAIEAM